MLKRHKLRGKALWGLFLLCLMFCLIPIQARAAKEQVPDAVIIGDDQGIQVESDGKYLMEIDDILPGQSFEKTISIMNIDEEGEPFELFFWIDPPKQIEGPINFAEVMSMDIDYQGKKIFEGKVSGIGNINLQKEEYSLGIFDAGDSRALKVFMKMDKNLTAKDYETRSITENVWHFRAIRKDEPTGSTDSTDSSGGSGGSGGTTSSTKPGGAGGSGTNGKKPLIRFPQTGEEWRDMLIYSCIGMFFIVVAVLLLNHAYQERKKRNGEGGQKK